MAAEIYTRSKGFTAVDRVVFALSQAMFNGSLCPGDLLREEKISKWFDVSRSTVREAIRVLTVDGLVTRQPNRTVVVRHLTVAEVDDIFRARMILEGACVRAAATCSDRTLEDLLREFHVYETAVSINDPPTAANAHVEFHANLVQILSGSHWLAETERSMLCLLHLIMGTVEVSGWELQEEIRSHRMLCECCCARQIEEALAYLKDGLDASQAFAIRFSMEAHALAKSPGGSLFELNRKGSPRS
jgi:DNA-binding GntR family transcriptional regulator